mgnify:CR=1 FL=1
MLNNNYYQFQNILDLIYLYMMDLNNLYLKKYHFQKLIYYYFFYF